MQPKRPFTDPLFSRALVGLAGGGVLLVALALAGLIGCGGTSDAPVPPPDRYGPVRVACPAALGRAVVKTYARNWEGQTEGRVEVVPYDPRTEAPPDGVDAW